MTTRTRTAPTWLRRLGEAGSFLLLCVSALAAIVLIIVPLLTGSQTYSVLTSSMEPSYPPGTFLVVTPTDFDTLETGDVVTYQLDSGRPEVITHRITGFTAGQDGERMLLTQGDNNAVADPDPVREVQVRGTLTYAVPYVGFLANALGQTDRGTLTTVLAVVLIGGGILTMAREGLTRRRQAAPADNGGEATSAAPTESAASAASAASDKFAGSAATAVPAGSMEVRA